MALDVGAFDHPSWLTAAGTVAGYLVILGLTFLALFVAPWLAFSALG